MNFLNKLNYRKINHDVMTDTEYRYCNDAELRDCVMDSISRQYVVWSEETIPESKSEPCETLIFVRGKRSLEAARLYDDEKVAVLNFANNHQVGGAPFSANAQEEAICRCSTLYPCLMALKDEFYEKHRKMYDDGLLTAMGNDDLIYTPDVVVFKSDERTNPIKPQMLERGDWYKVDVITCAAPEMQRMKYVPQDYEEVITHRIKRILDVANREGVEVLILGAWGCGAFKNSDKVVAGAFHKLLRNYNFKIVEFAMAMSDDEAAERTPFGRWYEDNEPQNSVVTGGYDRPYSPSKIETLADDEIFVFGSNIRGIHAGGAARLAYKKFGAKMGEGDGPTGRCYAIPTMEGGVDYVRGYVGKFIEYAREHTEEKFLVTRIGCGIAGFTDSEIAPLFASVMSMPNVLLPQEFVEILCKEIQ